MGASWRRPAADFKSPARVVIQFLTRSRESQAEKCRQWKEQAEQWRRESERWKAEWEAARRENAELRREVRRLEAERRTLAERADPLREDRPVGTHGYGPQMICLAVRLASSVGLRAAERVLTLVFEALKLAHQVPHWTTIRRWLLRLGVAVMNQPLEPADDWVYLSDHSNQIGPEKALVVLAVRGSQLPPPGRTLQPADVRVLAVRPGTTWKRENVAAVYEELAARHTAPRAVLSDGAVELREGAAALKTRRSDVIVLQDFKHKAANLLKALWERDKRFANFQTQVGQTRCAIQQTELAHLTPPSPKSKARFMNLGALLSWAATILWLLDHPEAKSRCWTTPERLEQKLGWLRGFAGDVAAWRECQAVIDRGLAFINREYLTLGAGEKLKAAFGDDLKHDASRNLAQQLIEFVAAAEQNLKPGERLPLSTELLESAFGLYKQLERQHSKGGFTSLLAAFPALLHTPTPASIRRDLAAVSNKDVQAWVRTHLGATLTHKRLVTYREFKRSTQRATKTIISS